MRKALCIALLGVLGIHAQWISPARAQTPSDAFAAGTAAFAAEDFERALAHFEAALAAGLDGPAVHYNIGVCRYKLGRYAEARAAFELVAERYPEMRALAEYNLGLVASREGDPRDAERHFRSALEIADDETIRYLARRQLGLDAAPATPAAPAHAAAPEWLALVDAQLGYDDNVLLLADEIPLPDGQSAESRFIEMWAMVSRPMARSRFRFDGMVYALRYPDASMFDQSVVQLGLPFEWTAWGWHGEIGPELSWTSIDDDVLDRRVGVGVGAAREIAPGTTLALRYVHDDVGEGDRRYAFLAGDRAWLEVRVDRRGERGRLTLSHALERNDREAATVSPRRKKLSLRYRYDLGADWLIETQASWRDSRYAELAEPRDEDLKELVLGATRILPEGWLVNASVTAADNDSEVETFAYTRRRIAVGVSKQF